MQERLRHALRFSLLTLVAVYVLGICWELFDVFVLGDVEGSLGAVGTFVVNEQEWRAASGGIAGAVFLLKLGDIRPGRPSWRYAALWALWVAISAVAVGIALDEGWWMTAGIVVVAAVAIWYATRGRLPGPPATLRALRAARALRSQADATERELR